MPEPKTGELIQQAAAVKTEIAATKNEARIEPSPERRGRIEKKLDELMEKLSKIELALEKRMEKSDAKKISADAAREGLTDEEYIAAQEQASDYAEERDADDSESGLIIGLEGGSSDLVE